MAKEKKIDSVDKLAALMADEFHEMHTWLSHQFERVGERFERVETRLEHIEADSRDFKEGLRRIEHDTGEIKSEMQAVSRAVDKDAETIVEHDRRIKKLEHAH
jgi:septation ring formation regulator EzrA